MRRRARPSSFKEGVEGRLPDRSIVLERVETPVLEPQPSPAPATAPRQPSQEELEWQAKTDVSLFFFVTVYDQVSEMHWWRNDGEYVIRSSIDFNYLRGISHFETPGARYSVFFSVDNVSRAS